MVRLGSTAKRYGEDVRRPRMQKRVLKSRQEPLMFATYLGKKHRVVRGGGASPSVPGRGAGRAAGARGIFLF